MDFTELDNEQRRQLIDTQQVYGTWWPAEVGLHDVGSLHWQKSKGTAGAWQRHRDRLRVAEQRAVTHNSAA